MARIPGPCPGFRIQVIVRYTMDSGILPIFGGLIDCPGFRDFAYMPVRAAMRVFERGIHGMCMLYQFNSESMYTNSQI